MGIPDVGIITDRFQRSAELMAELNGVPNYGFILIPHPIANNSDEMLRKKAESIIARMVALWTSGRSS